MSPSPSHRPIARTTFRARIVDNPYSFRGPYPVARVEPTFRAAGWEVDVVHRLPDRPGRELFAGALTDGVQLLISAGGDGTLRDIASAVAGSSLPLGILPGGTANVLARELGIPRRPEWAARLLVAGVERRLDLGRLELADGRWARFALAAGLGFDAAALHGTDPGLKRRVGPLAIGLGLIRAIPDLRRFGIEVSVDGRPAWEGRVWQLLVGNASRYAVALRPNPDARPDDGLLDLCLATGKGPADHWRMLRWLAARGVPDPQGARWFRGRVFDLTLSDPVWGELDGSPVALPLDGRLRISVEPGGLRVRLPRSRR